MLNTNTDIHYKEQMLKMNAEYKYRESSVILKYRQKNMIVNLSRVWLLL